VLAREGHVASSKKQSMQIMSAILSSPARYAFAGKVLRWMLRNAPGLINNRFNPWYKQRDMPVPPKESFQEWYRKNRKSNG
jgi:L-lactate dehydrogenase complex protein LldF